MSDHYSIKDMQEYASYQGGKCLSKEYWGIDKKLTWMCEEGHTWEAAFQIIRQGGWCPACFKQQQQQKKNKERQEKILIEFQTIAKERGGKLLSENYVNNSTIMQWECAKGHIWKTRALNIKMKRWCPKCAYVTRGNKTRLPIEFYQKLAIEKGGKCLSTEYTRSRSKLEFECKEGHKWTTSTGNVNRGSWCPKCGIEQAGLKQRDSIEKYIKIAEEHGGKCLSTEHINSFTKLLFECAEKHQWLATPSQIKQGNWCRICAYKKNRENMKGSIETYQKYAEERGGKCLTTEYISSRHKLEFLCANNHKFYSWTALIAKGKWCAKCENNKVGRKKTNSIATFQKIALQKKGKCLSTEYYDSQSKLHFECAEKHQWFATPGSIKKGTWCPVCAVIRRRKNP